MTAHAVRTPSGRGIAMLTFLAACGGEPTPPPSPDPDLVEATTVADQLGPAGAPVNAPPAVRVLTTDGRPVPGVTVRFAATGSTVTPSSAVTDADGTAGVVEWRLGTGPARLEATVTGLPAAVFLAEGRPRTFDLAVRWLTPPSAEAQLAVTEAVAYFEKLIWDDLPDQNVVATPVCPLPGVGPAATIDESVDDVLILAQVGPIDGLGGAGAQGFPCLIRDPGTQTIVGFVRFDEAEFGVIGPDLRREFVLHEMVHALGLVPGVINITTPSGFVRACLKLPSSGPPNQQVQDSHFACDGARAGFDRIGGARYPGAKVPLENGATMALTANTLNHHWRKTSLRNELMTGWFTSGVPAPLSLVTAGALQDLGYSVSLAAAHPFSLDGTIAPATDATPRAEIRLLEPTTTPPPLFLGRGPRPTDGTPKRAW
ncbi:MAG: hypothetical protein SFV24_21000 [Gemmatimonadales bacterium]|nr:hypothetical protein [Gemmatimonadales bacterium]